MVGSVLYLSLLGLTAVSALPAQSVEERQTFVIGPPGGGEVEWGSGIPKCAPNPPSGEQAPCIAEPSSGGFKIPKVKRNTVTLNSIGAYSAGCPNLKGAQESLKRLLKTPKGSVDLYIETQKLKHLLNGCGFILGDDTVTYIKVADKRDSVNFFPINEDVSGLEDIYNSLVDDLGDSELSLAPWLTLNQYTDLLGAFGVNVDRSVTFGAPALLPRQGGDFKLGKEACTQSVIRAYTIALERIVELYGNDPSRVRSSIIQLQQSISAMLQVCNDGSVGGFLPQPTVPGGPITPNPTIPGGPLRPDPYVPGGEIKPDPTVPGGPMTPDPTIPGGPMKPGRRTAQLTDPSTAALLTSLRNLESAYGSFGSPNIPSVIFLIMVDHVLALQRAGVKVSGWPVLSQDLGGGSVTFRPIP